jgi:hypothetical protein
LPAERHGFGDDRPRAPANGEERVVASFCVEKSLNAAVGVGHAGCG